MKPLFSCDNCSNVYQHKDKYELHIFKCQAAVQSTHAISTTGNLPSSDMPSMVNIPSAGKRSNKLFTSFAADLVNSSLCLTLRDISDDENQNEEEDIYFESESSDAFAITDTDENAHNDANIAEFPESAEDCQIMKLK